MIPAPTPGDAGGAPSGPRRVPLRVRALSPERDLMRQLFVMLGGDRNAVCRAYVEAERAGRIDRPRDAEEMAPDIHAGALWWEGRLKGWLRS